MSDVPGVGPPRGSRVSADLARLRAERAAGIAAQRRVPGSWQQEAEDLDAPYLLPQGSPAPSRRRVGLLAALSVPVLLALVLVVVSNGSEDAVESDPTAPTATPRTSASTKPTPARPRRLKALPPVVPGKGGYALLAYDGRAGDAKWDPCRRIHYVTREKNAPAGGQEVVRQAFAKLSAATGLVFVDDGATTEGPSERRDPTQLRYGAGYAPVLITWSSPREAGDLKGTVDGYAGAQPADPDGKGLRLVTGEVTLDAPAFRDYERGFRLEIVLHELGHLVGLDHVDDDDDIMYFESDGVRPLTGYTPGARRGLHLAGQGTCFR